MGLPLVCGWVQPAQCRIVTQTAMRARVRRNAPWASLRTAATAADPASEFSDTTPVLNHVGGPIGIGPYAGQREAVFGQWQRSMQRLAACENVTLKPVGMGMGMGMFGFDFAHHDQPPHPPPPRVSAGSICRPRLPRAEPPIWGCCLQQARAVTGFAWSSISLQGFTANGFRASLKPPRTA